MVSARVAALLALREGPSYGRELLLRVSRATGGQVRLSEGTLYPALRALRAARLIRMWSVIPGGKRGARERKYYELTVEGVREAEGAATALVQLADGQRRRATLSEPEREAMRSRMRRVAAISEAAMALRDAAARVRRQA